MTKLDLKLMQLMANGLSIKELTVALKLSEHWVETRRSRLYRRLGVHNGCELVAYGFRHGMVR